MYWHNDHREHGSEKLAKHHKTLTGIHRYIGIEITENVDQGKLAQSNIRLTLEYINILA